MRSLLVPFVVVLGLFAVRPAHAGDDENDFRPDVLACENAVAKLVACCPGFNPKLVTCVYFDNDDQGCDDDNEVESTPTYGEGESACIIASTCDYLVANVCTRAQNAKAVIDYSGSEEGTSTGSGSYFAGSEPGANEDGSDAQVDARPVCP